MPPLPAQTRAADARRRAEPAGLVRRGLALAFALLAGCAAGGSPSSADRAALARAHEREMEALRAGDLARFERAFADGAVIVSSDGRTLVGKPEILASYRGIFAAGRSDPSTEILDVVVSGDWALERFAFSTHVEPADGSPPFTVHGVGVHVYRRGADGIWRIAYDTFQEGPPPAPPR